MPLQCPRGQSQHLGDKGKSRYPLWCKEQFPITYSVFYFFPMIVRHLMVQSQGGITFRETAVHQKKKNPHIIKSNSNLYPVPKEKAQGMECMFNAHQVIFEKSITSNFCHSQYPSHRWQLLPELTLPPALRDRPKTLRDVQPVRTSTPTMQPLLCLVLHCVAQPSSVPSSLTGSSSPAHSPFPAWVCLLYTGKPTLPWTRYEALTDRKDRTLRILKHCLFPPYS